MQNNKWQALIALAIAGLLLGCMLFFIPQKRKQSIPVEYTIIGFEWTRMFNVSKVGNGPFKVENTYKTHGEDKTPYWDAYQLQDDEYISRQFAYYKLILRDKYCRTAEQYVTMDEWMKFQEGDKIVIETPIPRHRMS